MEKISQSKVKRFLQKELDAARKLLVQLDTPPCRAMDKLQLDLRSAIDVIRRCRSPSPIVEKVMSAFLLLLGEPEDQISVS